MQSPKSANMYASCLYQYYIPNYIKWQTRYCILHRQREREMGGHEEREREREREVATKRRIGVYCPLDQWINGSWSRSV